MIVMINGAFGVGKTTVANELMSKLDNCMLFDPEMVGFMLREIVPNDVKLPEERTDNFQDFYLWRSLTLEVAKGLRETYQKNLIVPMTIFNKDYFKHIFEGFQSFDPETYHFCLTASKETIHQRLLQRGEEEGNWCFQQTAKCLDAFQDPCFGEFIKTDDKSIARIVQVIKKYLHEER